MLILIVMFLKWRKVIFIIRNACAHPSEIASKSLSSSGIGDGMLAVLVVRGMGETLAGAR